MPTQIQTWFENNIPDFTFRGAAKITGLNLSSLRRHLISEPATGPAIETIIDICRAYDLNPVPALVAAGVLTPAEIGKPELTIEELPDHAMLEELLRRSRANHG